MPLLIVTIESSPQSVVAIGWFACLFAIGAGDAEDKDFTEAVLPTRVDVSSPDSIC